MIQITEKTNLLISELNNKLKNCPGLQLTILPNGTNTFKLCLLNNNVCVSYLIINNDSGNFNILSRTDSQYQGRGYNKFLTAVSIYLADTMTKSKYLYSATSVAARIHILSEYKQGLEKIDEEYDNEEYDDEEYKSENEEDNRIFYIPIYENKNKAKNIITEWINNKCVKSKANVKGGGKKTRRNKQRRKNKTQRRKSKKTQNKKII
jgi:hypothetical protein